jgi:hypothetical protein
MTRLAETCVCGAQFSVDDNYHHAKFVYDRLDAWRKEHPCPQRDAPSVTAGIPPRSGAKNTTTDERRTP